MNLVTSFLCMCLTLVNESVCLYNHNHTLHLSFVVALFPFLLAPPLWNSLPTTVKNEKSVDVQDLAFIKTFLSF